MALAKKSPARQLFGFGLVVLLHVALIWAVKSGLANSLVELVSGPMETKLIEEKVAEKEAPPPPKVDMKPLPPPVVIPVDIDVAAAPVDNTTSINTAARATSNAPPPAAVNNNVVPPRSNPRRPVTQPEYPPTSKRLGEAGTVIMLLTVNEEGKVTEAKIDTSSGFERLDEAALKEALRTWRLLPGTQGGKPITMQYKFKVVFKIENN